MSAPTCDYCGTSERLGHVMLFNKYLCETCEMFLDTTFCGVCGIIGMVEDMNFASNGDGPNCPDCTDILEESIADTESGDGDDLDVWFQSGLDYDETWVDDDDDDDEDEEG